MNIKIKYRRRVLLRTDKNDLLQICVTKRKTGFVQNNPETGKVIKCQ